MQKLTERQVRHWIESIFGSEGPEDGEHFVSPVARFTACALVDVPYVPSHSHLESRPAQRELRKFRAFLDEVVRVMDGCGVQPWTDGEQAAADACKDLDR